MGGGAWWAAVHGVTKSRTRLKRLSSLAAAEEELDPLINVLYELEVGNFIRVKKLA